MRRTIWFHGYLAAFFTLAGAVVAAAQGTVDPATYRYNFSSGSFESDGASDTETDADTSGTLDASNIGLSLDRTTGAGSAFSTYRATVDMVESESGYSGSVSIVTNSNAPADAIAQGLSTSSEGALFIDFDVVGEPVLFETSGLAQAISARGGEGVVAYRVEGANSVVFADSRTGETSTGIDEQLTLAPGSYSLVFECRSQAGAVFKGGDMAGNANITVDIEFSGASSEIFWSTNDGSFEDEENWEPQQVPNSDQTAIFDRAATYTVTLANPNPGRLLFERGTVTFDGNTLMAIGGDVDNPPLIVGHDATDAATLRMFIGDVSTLGATIGRGPGTNGTIVVDGTTEWAAGGTVTVGEQGMGQLTIDDGAQVIASTLHVGESAPGIGTVAIEGAEGISDLQNALSVGGQTIIGDQGTGTMTLLNGRINTQETILGNAAGANGTAQILESSQFSAWVFNRELVVGNAGSGAFDVFNGGFLRATEGLAVPVTIAKADGSMGDMTLNGEFATLTTTGPVSIGAGGIGLLELFDDATMGVGAVYVGPYDGSASTGKGTFNVRGAGEILEGPNVLVSGEIAVGDRGVGSVLVDANANLRSTQAFVGSLAGGMGTVTLINGGWEATERFVMGLESDEGVTLGMGTLTLIDGQIDTALFACDGDSTIAGFGLIFSQESLCGCTIAPGIDAIDVKQDEDPIGTLTFGGDATFDDAMFNIDASGPVSSDMIVVTGNADVSNATVRFNFTEGYAPQQGDTLPFVMAEGALTIDANTTMEFTGVEDGFQFDVTAENGMLVFEALNDAVSTTGNGGGIGCAAGSTGNSRDDAVIVFLAMVLALCLQRRAHRASASLS